MQASDDSVPPFGSGGVPPWQGQPWQQAQAQGQAQVQGYGRASPGFRGAPPLSGDGDPGRAPRIVAVVLFGLDAIANALGLFGADDAWKNPVDEISLAAFVAAAVLTAALLLPRRTRGFAAGFALAQVLTETARFIFSVRPSAFDEFNWAEKISNTGSYVITVPAGLVVAVAMLRERRGAVRAPREPIPTLALAVPGAVLAVLGLLIADYTWFYGGVPGGYPCCSWSSGDGFLKASYLLTAVAFAACVLLALLISRPGFAKGIWAGAAAFQAISAIVVLINTIAPTQAVYGYQATTPSEQVTAHPQAGLWFTLVGLALFAIAFLVQDAGRPGSSSAAYPRPQQPFLLPPQPGQPDLPSQPGQFGAQGWQQPRSGYPQPGYPQAGYPQPGDAQTGPIPPGGGSDTPPGEAPV